MVTTITNALQTEFIDYLDNNIFLKSIFPSGLGDILVGQFGLDQGQFSLNIHIFKKPQKEVKKWGTWGINYDVIVIKLLGTGVEDIRIHNWENFNPAPLICWKHEERIFISCKTEAQIFEFSCAGLVFQKSSIYIA